MRNQVTIHAQLTDQIGLVATRSFQAQLSPANFKRIHHESTLNVEHDRHRPVGRLVGLERDERSGIWATFVSSEVALLAIPEPYISGAMRWEGRGAHTREIEIVGAAIVEATASTCVRPATVLAGDLLQQRDRARWRNLSQPMRDRLERAADQYGRRAKRRGQVDADVIDVIDYRHAPAWRDSSSRYDRPRIEIRPCRIIGIS